MDNRTCYCRNPDCVLHGRAGAGYNGLSVCECLGCGQRVSARTGTAYAGIRTDLGIYRRGAKALAEGLSIRGTGRRVEVDQDTVMHWLPILGQHGQGVMNRLWRLSQPASGGMPIG